MIDLRPKDRQAIESLAKAQLPLGSCVWAYGSRVKGTNHDTSDLDLCVELPQPDTEALSHLRQAFQDSNIPILIQVLDWHEIPESFKDNILKTRELLIKVEPSA